MHTPKGDVLIEKITIILQSLGWSISEEECHKPGTVHIKLTMGSERKGCGCFEREYAYTELYEEVAGMSWMRLFKSIT